MKAQSDRRRAMTAVSTQKRYTTEQIANRSAPSGAIILEGVDYPSYTVNRRDRVTQVVFPNLSTAPAYMVSNNANVIRVIAQKAAIPNEGSLASNPKLQCVDIYGAAGKGMGSLSFMYDTSLETLIIRTPGGVYFPYANMFNGANVSSSKPVHVYVPAALRPSYENSEKNGKWSSFLSAGSVVFHDLEGSAYENLNWWRN